MISMEVSPKIINSINPIEMHGFKGDPKCLGKGSNFLKEGGDSDSFWCVYN